MTEALILTEVQGKVGVARLNRPDAYNALNAPLMRQLGDTLATWDSDPAIGAMVITGNDRAFASGADIKEMSDASAIDMLTVNPIGLYDRVAAMKKPVIAAVSGFALGGGCELAMMCDMIVASQSAIFGQPEINLGVIPGAGGTQRLIRAVGKTIAMEMILNARRLTADEAYQFGLVNRVYAVDEYFAKALELAAQIADRAPVAIQLAKESVSKAYEMSLSEGLAFERRNFYFLFSTEDQKEGMDAFLNKRPAGWKGQ
jgi:enoyl-CoA hydratase